MSESRLITQLLSSLSVLKGVYCLCLSVHLWVEESGSCWLSPPPLNRESYSPLNSDSESEPSARSVSLQMKRPGLLTAFKDTSASAYQSCYRKQDANTKMHLYVHTHTHVCSHTLTGGEMPSNNDPGATFHMVAALEKSKMSHV